MLNSYNRTECTSDSCKTDRYDQPLEECVEFLVHNRCARIQRIINENQKRSEYLRLQKFAKAFTVSKCFFQTNHLWFEEQKVLMAKEAYDFIYKIHGEEHLHGLKMVSKVRQFSIYLPPLFDFINQFSSYCSMCLQRGIKPIRCTSPIWHTLQTNFFLNLKNTSRQQSISQILAQIQVDYCPKNTCVVDEYDNDNQICLYYLTYDKFPPLPMGQGAISNLKRIKKKAMLLRHQTCNQGTKHLWVRGHDTRIPMKKQAENIARLLHGQRAHRNKRVMMQILSQQKKIYYHEVQDAIRKIVDQCVVCNPRNAINHDSSDQQGFRRTFAFKSKAIPLGRMGKAERAQCARQVMQNQNLRQKFGRIKNILDRITIWEDAKSYIRQIIRQENVSELAAQIAIQNLHWSRAQDEDIDQVMNNIPQIIYRTYREENIKKVIFVCTKTMKYHYLKYGDSLCIDYLTGAVRSRQASGRHFLVGFFSGQNAQGNNVLFGLTLISTQLSLYHMKSFELFFNAMGGEHLPGAIITPDSRPLYLSLDIIKSKHNYQYDNFMSWFYVVEFLKKNSVNQLQKDKILNMFCQSFTQPVYARYLQIMHSIRSQMVSTSIYKQIQKFGEKFCICRIPPKFVGFGLTTERVQCLYQLLEKKMEYHPKISTFFSNLFQMQRQLWDHVNIVPSQPHNKSKLKYPQLEQFTGILHQKVFLQLQSLYQYQIQNITIKQHIQTKKNPKPSNPAIVQIEDKLTKCIYTVKYFCSEMCWKCNCRLTYFIGLPCSHMIKVIMLYGGSLRYYINTRWVIEEKDMEYERLYENRGLVTEYKKQGMRYVQAKLQAGTIHRYRPNRVQQHWIEQPYISNRNQIPYEQSMEQSSGRHPQSSSYSRMSMTDLKSRMKSRFTPHQYSYSQYSQRGDRNKFYQNQPPIQQERVPRFRSLYNQALGQQVHLNNENSREFPQIIDDYQNPRNDLKYVMQKVNQYDREYMMGMDKLQQERYNQYNQRTIQIDRQQEPQLKERQNIKQENEYNQQNIQEELKQNALQFENNKNNQHSQMVRQKIQEIVKPEYIYKQQAQVQEELKVNPPQNNQEAQEIVKTENLMEEQQ